MTEVTYDLTAESITSHLPLFTIDNYYITNRILTLLKKHWLVYTTKHNIEPKVYQVCTELIYKLSALYGFYWTKSFEEATINGMLLKLDSSLDKTSKNLTAVLQHTKSQERKISLDKLFGLENDTQDENLIIQFIIDGS